MYLSLFPWNVQNVTTNFPPGDGEVLHFTGTRVIIAPRCDFKIALGHIMISIKFR